MTPELERLRSTLNLPTLPTVATRLIDLAQDPNVKNQAVIDTIACDPALSAKMLSVANSAWYIRRHKTETLSQALRVLGLNTTLTLVLSFSLLKALRGSKTPGLDYGLFWRRSLLSAISARTLAEILGQIPLEEVFLAALIQDLGIMALCKVDPGLYAKGEALQRNHGQLIAHECERFGYDHAAVGAWLLSSWHLPDRVVEAVRESHRGGVHHRPGSGVSLNEVVSLSGPIADLFLWPQDLAQCQALGHRMDRVMGISSERLNTVFDRILTVLPETQRLFEMDLLGRNPDEVIVQARELMAARQTSQLVATH